MSPVCLPACLPDQSSERCSGLPHHGGQHHASRCSELPTLPAAKHPLSINQDKVGDGEGSSWG